MQAREFPARILSLQLTSAFGFVIFGIDHRIFLRTVIILIGSNESS